MMLDKVHTVMERRRRATLCHLLAVFAITVCVSAFVILVQCTGAESSYEERQVKAAFLFNFVKFVEWPEGSFRNPESPIIVTVLGKDPFGDAIDHFRSKTVNGRSLVIKRIRSLGQLERSHVLFVSESERDNLAEIIKIAGEWNALTVGDMRNFARAGGIINMVTIDKKIGFEINLSSAEGAQIKISSKLLKLGRIIQNNERG